MMVSTLIPSQLKQDPSPTPLPTTLVLAHRPLTVGTVASYNTVWDMKSEITYIEFSFSHLSYLNPCWIDWLVFHGQSRQWHRKAAWVESLFSLECKKRYLEVSFLACCPELRCPGFSFPSDPEVGYFSPLPVFLVKVTALSSGKFPIAQDPQLDNRKIKCHSHFLVLTLETRTSPLPPFLFLVPLTS